MGAEIGCGGGLGSGMVDGGEEEVDEDKNWGGCEEGKERG
jgi:hypothetical protein